MPETAALVPVPFHAPARTDTGTPFHATTNQRFGQRIVRRVGPPASVPPEGLMYGREGRLMAGLSIGRIVSIYI